MLTKIVPEPTQDYQGNSRQIIDILFLMMLELVHLLHNIVLHVPTFINKTVMVLLLCLIFIGQSMASMTMFYGMTAMSSIKSAHHNMTGMTDCYEKAASSTSSMACSTTSTEDCCAQECDCLTSGCSTASAFAAVINYGAERVTSNKIISATGLVTSQAPTSLYRPPILS